MTIEWNKVTWYSKLGALAVLIITIILAVYLWNEYQQIQNLKSIDSFETALQHTIDNNEQSITEDWQTYHNTEFGFEFQYPSSYYTTGRRTCNVVTNTSISCLDGFDLAPTSSTDFDPKSSFYLIKGVNSVSINGQASGIRFNSEEKAWVLIQVSLSDTDNFERQILEVWGYTNFGQEIIKGLTGGSHAFSAFYIIPDYKKDIIAVFRIPVSYRLRCDIWEDVVQREDECNQFYQTLLDGYNGGQPLIDTWLPEEYIRDLYIDTEKILSTFRFVE